MAAPESNPPTSDAEDGEASAEEKLGRGARTRAKVSWSCHCGCRATVIADWLLITRQELRDRLGRLRKRGRRKRKVPCLMIERGLLTALPRLALALLPFFFLSFCSSQVLSVTIVTFPLVALRIDIDVLCLSAIIQCISAVPSVIYGYNCF